MQVAVNYRVQQIEPDAILPFVDDEQCDEFLLCCRRLRQPRLSGASARAMTTTANHRGTAGAAAAAGSSMAPEPEEDIAAIAKQISDHAEAIYQTWKARGLAPNEILTCHRDSSTAADKFGSVLTPQPKPSTVAADARHLLSDPNTNNLERLVNKFVVEDKARLQAARQSRSLSPKPFASSIQYALQKFEQKASSPVAEQPIKLNGGCGVKRYSKSPVKSYPEELGAVTSSCNGGKTTVALQSPVGNDASSSWPFRNGGKTSSSSSSSVDSKTSCNNTNFMDEVAKEEQRLIDALKNGSVVENRKIGEKPVVPSKEGVLLRSAAAGYDIGNRSKPEFLIGLSALSSSRRNLHTHRQQEQVPHPELTDHQRANIRSNHHLHQSNPVRPFLTRGSVAERVLIFEKCPTELMKNSATNSIQSWKNIGSDVHSKIQVSPHFAHVRLTFFFFCNSSL